MVKNGLLFLLVLTISTMLWGCGPIQEMDEIEISPFPERKIELTTLYFKVKGARSLERETRVIERTFESAEEMIVKELINGPTEEHLLETLPRETKVQGVIIIGSTAYVNLSQEFIWEFDEKIHDESITIYSIVNTLTELNKIDDVQILVDGETLNQYQQYVSLKQIFDRNEKVMREELPYPHEVLKRYFQVIDEQDYRRAYDELYIPLSQNIDYLNFYRYMLINKGHIEKHKITKYSTQYMENEIVLKVDYDEENFNGEIIEHIGEPFHFRNHLGEWKIVIDDIE
ncbi:hypothetical protein Amet_2327 [Alkaliphilus metalliredigens QYMF]|uniref:GerMN domain-containing protein n=1 Tax=Alkaliphilus metalliredigens (strain QYMF) TaxID=293826 RepID=A6TQL6_ALKMQ|nr:GerMN domain-containing protein [Alkaliphilus metalliredigens]ABR48484.1 hypothetical protein Amet_2327 [Alkaliphilus metalliredigens QYMF]